MSGTDDLGAPVSFLALDEGTAVYAADGEEVGQVAHVLANEEEDIFDGIVIAHGLGRHTFADAEPLPEPSENPAVMEETSEDEESSLSDKLRRAWDLLSGNY